MQNAWWNAFNHSIREIKKFSLNSLSPSFCLYLFLISFSSSHAHISVILSFPAVIGYLQELSLIFEYHQDFCCIYNFDNSASITVPLRSPSVSRSKSGVPLPSGPGVPIPNPNLISFLYVLFFLYFKINVLLTLIWLMDADIVVDNCAICRNHIMDLCVSFSLDFIFQLFFFVSDLWIFSWFINSDCLIWLFRYRVPSQPSQRHQWGMHCCLGYVFFSTPEALRWLNYTMW